MRINRIEFENFRNYRDRGSITFPTDGSVTIIYGPNGVGKTTMVLQHIKLHEDVKTSLFVYADDIWFSTHSILELAEDFYKDGGKALYIDEIHKYQNWSQEIKNIYDSFPKLKVCYTGKS